MNRSLWLLAGLALTGLVQASVPPETHEAAAYEGQASVGYKVESISVKDQSVTQLSQGAGIVLFGESFPMSVERFVGTPEDAAKGVCHAAQRNEIMGWKVVVSKVGAQGAVADPVVEWCNRDLKIETRSVGPMALQVGQTQAPLLIVGNQSLRWSFTYTPDEWETPASR